MSDPVARWVTGRACRLCTRNAVTYVLYGGRQMWLCDIHLGEYLDVAQEFIAPPGPVLDRDEARELSLTGWDIRCNRCGTYGARWVPEEINLALCVRHEQELVGEYARHQRALAELRAHRYEQESNVPGPR